MFQYVIYFIETSNGHFAVCTRDDYSDTDIYVLFMLNGIWIPICFYLSLAGLESARRYWKHNHMTTQC